MLAPVISARAAVLLPPPRTGGCLQRPALHGRLPGYRAQSGAGASRGGPLGVGQLARREQYGHASSRKRCSRGVARAEKGADPVDRLTAAVPYLVPLFDGLKYGGAPAAVVLGTALLLCCQVAPLLGGVCRPLLLQTVPILCTAAGAA